MTAGVAAAVLATAAFVPSLAIAQGDLVDGLLKGLLGGNGSGGAQQQAGGAVTPAAGTPPNYQPPLHGTSPHGQGTVGVIDAAPSNGVPLGDDPETGTEDVVVGDSVGSQDQGGNYHGRITLLHLNLLGLVNFPALVEVKTNEGETKHGPLEPVQTNVLDNVCAALTQPAGCVTVLKMDSSTSNTGSTNEYQTAGINLPGIANVGAANSEGSISESGSCQTATGSSSVANASLFGGVVNAGVLNGSSQSIACANGTKTVTNDSDVATLNSFNVINLIQPGCGTAGNPGTPATPDTQVVNLAPLASIVCAADDANGVGEGQAQTGAPYGVRESLTAFLLNLPVGGIPLLNTLLPLKVAVAGPESHAVAPTVPGTSPGNAPTDDDGGGNRRGQNDGGGDEGPDEGGPVAATAQPGGDQLAFTGINLLVLALIGASLMFGGLLLASTARRHRRAAA